MLLVEIPIRGGMITEGVVGTTPPKINPIAVSPFTSPAAESDLIALVYSGLMQALPTGELIPNLAKSYSISEDGLTYTFVLKDNLIWHDGMPITSDDVKFTVWKAQDPDVGSRQQANWDSVIVETPDQKTVVFTLTETYAPFLQNTTMGILPKHHWEKADPERFSDHPLNTRPIGSGPFRVTKIKTNGNDIIEYYELESFENYALGTPFIDTIRIMFFTHKEDLIEAYKDGRITNINSISPEKARELNNDHRIEYGYLPRIFSAFFNQNEADIFTKKEVRQALDIAIDREEIINKVLFGYATEIMGPLPPGSLGYIAQEKTEVLTQEDRITKAQDILEESGWERNENGIFIKEMSDNTLALSFSISTTNEAPELTHIAEILKQRWEKIGAEVNIKSFETKDNLKNYAIRPRDYEILLFGEIIGVNSDPYAFWHSSQRLDPGLNIASYTNVAVDKALERARATSSKEARVKQFKIFQEEIQNDIPAVFLYAPQLIYATRDSVHGMDLDVVNTPSERFLNVHEWYLKTERVWKFFAK